MVYKKRSRVKFPILQKSYVFGGYHSILTAVFVASKHLKVFDTTVFLEAIVSSKYFEKTELPNEAVLQYYGFEKTLL